MMIGVRVWEDVVVGSRGRYALGSVDMVDSEDDDWVLIVVCGCIAGVFALNRRRNTVLYPLLEIVLMDE